MRKFIDWIAGKNNSTKNSELNLQVFIDWIKKQNTANKFAKSIDNGTTVYFSDDFAACYDLRITGFGESNNTIVVQEDIQSADDANERFLEISIETWTKLNWEVWYLDSNLKWMIIANKDGPKKYNNNDLIKSERINFEFKLKEINHLSVIQEEPC